MFTSEKTPVLVEDLWVMKLREIMFQDILHQLAKKCVVKKIWAIAKPIALSEPGKPLWPSPIHRPLCTPDAVNLISVCRKHEPRTLSSSDHRHAVSPTVSFAEPSRADLPAVRGEWPTDRPSRTGPCRARVLWTWIRPVYSEKGSRHIPLGPSIVQD